MSDSRKRSHRSSSTHGNSRRHGSRDLGATSTSSASRSSTSVHRASSGSGGGSGGGGDSGRHGRSRRDGGGRRGDNDYLTVPGAGSSNAPPGANQIYGNMAQRASASRFSLTEQFAATRSVYDFGFDDAASSIFDAQSIFSVSTARAPSPLRGLGPSAGGRSSSNGSDMVMVGYSTLLEEEEDNDEDDEDDGTTTDVEQTPKPAKPKRNGGGASARSPEKQRREDNELLLSSPLLRPVAAPVQPTRRTCYELLGLARHPAPHPAQIRGAYYRLSRLLGSGSGSRQGVRPIPTALQPTAVAYSGLVQAAFETLINPERRLEYDQYLDEVEEEEDQDSGSESDNEGESDELTGVEAYALPADPLQSTTDLGVRYDASQLLLPHAQRTAAPSSLDYSLTHVVRVGLPSLGQFTEARLQQVQRHVDAVSRRVQALRGGPAASQHGHSWPIHCGTPVVSLSASTYAVTSPTPSGALSSDRFQPLLPEILDPRRALQLAGTRATGCVVVGYRQEFAWGPESDLPPTVVDIDTELLPQVAVTTRVSQSVPLTIPLVDEALGVPRDEPLSIEVLVQSGKSVVPVGFQPRLGLGLSRRMGVGSAFVCVDSGNGYRALPVPPPAVLPAVFAPYIAPMVEIGYSVSPHELGLHNGRPLTGPADRGLKGVDADMNAFDSGGSSSSSKSKSSWTASVAVSGQTAVAAYLRYGRSLSLTPWWRRLGTKSTSRQTGRNVRVEAEVSAGRWTSEVFLAVRGLAPLRWWGFRRIWATGGKASRTPPKLGLEVALSGGSGSVHVSLYWARLGQRIKLPFLLLPAASQGGISAAAQVFFWAAVLPVTVVAAREAVQAYLRMSRQRKKRTAAKAAAETKAETEAEAETETDPFEDAEEEQAIARHRAEADELTMLLAAAMDAQAADVDRAKDAQHRLTILSAKYGVALADDAEANANANANADDDAAHPGDSPTTVVPDDNPWAQSPGPNASGTAAAAVAATMSLSAVTASASAMATRNGWAPDYEVADVTAAVAALVERPPDGASDDRLVIPGALRKSRLLGFWDPAPHFRQQQQQQQRRRRQLSPPAVKVLHVRYLWRGQEKIAEVADKATLRLP